MKYLKLLVFVMLFSSCDKLTKGKCINKYYNEGYYYTTTQYINNMPLIQTNYADPEYIVILRGVYKNNVINERFSIRSNEWYNVEIGDTVRFEE